MLAVTSAVEGMSASQAHFDLAVNKIVQATAPSADSKDTVDLSAAAVALMMSRNSFDANTKVVKAASEMELSVVNAIG
jgi:hypothetical protein